MADLASLAPVLAQAEFARPSIDWFAASPELTLLALGAIVTLLDIVFLERAKPIMPALTGLAFLITMIPIILLSLDDELPRQVFDGSNAYVVDQFSLVVKGMFLLTGYVVVLLATNYMAEGDYWESEFYTMLLASILGMVVMASARDLISVFVALELLSIPAYMMATWRKRDLKSNEAGLKYYLMGVFASAIMLYGMSLLFGATGTTVLSEINASLVVSPAAQGVVTLGVVFVVIGFAFKVSAVPFHTWAPDTYEGAPTPTTAFLATASKAAGFVALMIVIVVGFYSQADVYRPFLWFLAILTMTTGNLMALRQTNVVRLMAYSGVAQAGYMLAALAVVGDNPGAIDAIVAYLVIYMAMNLGAFAVIIAVARKTGSAELSSFNGLLRYAPGLTVTMTLFLFALAGIPPLGGWFAKFAIFVAVIEPGTWWGYVLGGFIAVNSVIALYYYARVARHMWGEEPVDGDITPIRIPLSLNVALGITAVVTLGLGIFPGGVADLGRASRDLCPNVEADEVATTPEECNFTGEVLSAINSGD
jgi:NADH-quinone oxidoreductase subunit N